LAAEIDMELAKADAPVLVIASRQLEKEILRSKTISSSAQEKLPKNRDYPSIRDWQFWRAYLELDSLSELS
jgi:hypothetical protein